VRRPDASTKEVFLMSFIRTAALAAFVTAASSAMAADLDDLLPPAPVLDEAPETWYLRGDIGAVRHSSPEADLVAGPIVGRFAQDGIADTALVGVGVGYRFTPMLRMDVTLDHRFDARFKGVATAPVLIGALLDRGQFQSSTLMLNAYVDLGTWNGLTPYVGAGFGVAHNVLSHHARITADGSGSITSWERIAGDSDDSFAWALMAGLGYEILPGLTLDVGYRFVGLRGVKTRHYGLGSGVDMGTIGAHEARLGLRYLFD
jgi:opacity protein-like surface antigen